MLRSIAEQAANAVNLYTAISGVGYPFGELNLVNDPTAFLEGQAPGAIIYLGSGVFMSDGALAPVFDDASSISRFKRSVVAHEVGHKWWGATISHANDRNRWYRESLAEYFSALYLEFAFGYKDYLAQVDEWRRNLLQTNLKANVQSAQTLFAGEWGGGVAKDATTAAVYDKGPYAFHMLRETFRDPTIEQRGPEGADRRFFTFLKLFTRELAKKREIVTLDIQLAAERGLGGVDQDGNQVNVDLGWFFDQWIRGAGMPKYDFSYDVRRAEDGGYLVEGSIRQSVVIGSGKNLQTLEGQVYRGIIFVTAKAKGGAVRHRVIVNGPDTRFQFKVPNKPFEVVLNDEGEMLALDVAKK
jgi:aminopeptidase N